MEALLLQHELKLYLILKHAHYGTLQRISTISKC